MVTGPAFRYVVPFLAVLVLARVVQIRFVRWWVDPEAFVVAVLCDTGDRYLSKLYDRDWMEEKGFGGVLEEETAPAGATAAAPGSAGPSAAPSPEAPSPAGSPPSGDSR